MNESEDYTHPNPEIIKAARDEALERARREQDAFELSHEEVEAMHESMDTADLREELNRLTQKVNDLDAALTEHIEGITDWTHNVAGRFGDLDSQMDQVLALVNDAEAKAGLIPVSPELIRQALEDANEADDPANLIDAIDHFIMERRLNLVPLPHEAGDYPTLLVHSALRQASQALAEYYRGMPSSLGGLVPVEQMLKVIRNALPDEWF